MASNMSTEITFETEGQTRDLRDDQSLRWCVAERPALQLSLNP